MSLYSEENIVLKYRGYTGSINTCPEDNIMHGKVLYIDDLICYTGDDLKALEASFRTMVDEYIYDLTTTFNPLITNSYK